jgi:hypothetical protein
VKASESGTLCIETTNPPVVRSVKQLRATLRTLADLSFAEVVASGIDANAFNKRVKECDIREVGTDDVICILRAPSEEEVERMLEEAGIEQDE